MRGAEDRCWSLGLLEITLEFLGAHPVAKESLMYLWTHFMFRGHTAFLGLSGSNSGSPSQDFKKSLVNYKRNKSPTKSIYAFYDAYLSPAFLGDLQAQCCVRVSEGLVSHLASKGTQ